MILELKIRRKSYINIGLEIFCFQVMVGKIFHPDFFSNGLIRPYWNSGANSGVFYTTFDLANGKTWFRIAPIIFYKNDVILKSSIQKTQSII